MNKLMNKLTGAQIIYKSLQYYKIQHVFGYSGGANLPLLNAFFRDHHNKNPITFIKSSNEQCSGHTAEGYTKSLGNTLPGVIISTSGPGVTNILTPLQNALNDAKGKETNLKICELKEKIESATKQLNECPEGAYFDDAKGRLKADLKEFQTELTQLTSGSNSVPLDMLDGASQMY